MKYDSLFVTAPSFQLTSCLQLPLYQSCFIKYVRVEEFLSLFLQDEASSDDYEYEYEYEFVYDYVEDSPKTQSVSSKKERPKIVPKQRKPARTAKIPEKVKRLRKPPGNPQNSGGGVGAVTADAAVSKRRTDSETDVVTNYNPVTGTIDIVYPTIVVR